ETITNRQRERVKAVVWSCAREVPRLRIPQVIVKSATQRYRIIRRAVVFDDGRAIQNGLSRESSHVGPSYIHRHAATATARGRPSLGGLQGGQTDARRVNR